MIGEDFDLEKYLKWFFSFTTLSLECISYIPLLAWVGRVCQSEIQSLLLHSQPAFVVNCWRVISFVSLVISIFSPHDCFCFLGDWLCFHVIDFLSLMSGHWNWGHVTLIFWCLRPPFIVRLASYLAELGEERVTGDTAPTTFQIEGGKQCPHKKFPQYCSSYQHDVDGSLPAGQRSEYLWNSLLWTLSFAYALQQLGSLILNIQTALGPGS